MLTAIDPWRLAKNTQTLHGKFSLSEMPRLLSGLELDNSGEGYFEWYFNVNKAGRAYIEGHAEVEIQVVCQRCLQVMRVPLAAQTLLGLLSPRQNEDDLPEDWEPLVIDKIPMSLLDLLEDELILALPLVFRHDECPANQHQNTEEAEAMPAKENPFAVLAQLKQK